MFTKPLLCSLACCLSLAVSLAGPSRALASDEVEVERINDAFYKSLNALFTGNVEPMKLIWSHREDVTYMGPSGGYQIGWPQVLDQWEKQAAMKLGGEIASTETRIIVGNDLAFVHCYEQGNNLNSAGRPERVSIRATNLFRKEDGRWKMIGHHTDLLPFLEKESLTKAIEHSVE